MSYTRHVVVEMDDSMIQKCVICGALISDYTNARWPSGQEPPKGFPAGDVFILEGNPTIITTMYPEDHVEDCKS